MNRSCRLLHGQPRQAFEWNYFPLSTGRIVLSNKKRNFLASSELRFDTVDRGKTDKSETIDTLKDNIPEAIGEIQLQTIDNVLHGQPRQPFEWNYFPLLTGRIVLSNKKKRNLRKYSVVSFKAFSPKKSYLANPIYLLILTLSWVLLLLLRVCALVVVTIL